MRCILPAAACLLVFATGAAHAAEAKAPELSSRECGLSTPYNVQVDGGGVWLYRTDGAPREIFFHDGALSVDQQVRPVSQADAQRLRRIEDGARRLMPQVAGVARDSVDITFDALAEVTREMTGSERKARKVERGREDALEHIGDSLGKGRWDQDVFGAAFEAGIERTIAAITGSIARSALWAALTGRADRIDARSARLDGRIDRMLESRTGALEAGARRLCTQVAALHALQDALEYRHDGAPLVMLERTAAAAANEGGRVASRGDAGAGPATKVRAPLH